MKSKFVFTGDAEQESEKRVLKYYDDGMLEDVDVLKVGHHGSLTSTSYDFISVLNPEYSVISVGRNNEYNHPNQKIIDRIQAIGATIYRTDNNGNIVCGVSQESKIYFTYQYKDRLPVRIQLWQICLILSAISVFLIFAIRFENREKIEKIKKQTLKKN